MSSLSENNPKGEEMAPKNDGNNNNNNNPKLGASPRRLPSTTSSPVLVVKQSEIDYAITPRPLRILILVSTLLENLIFSGIIFGWPALFYMLKNENIYSELCEPVTDNSLVPANIFNVTTNANVKLDCSKQENKLNMAYTTGVFAMGFTSFVWGFMLEHQGLRFVRFALNLLISLGCAFLCYTTEDRSGMIVPAIIILGLIGVPLRIANMQIADYFPKMRSTIITIFSGAFSASPVVFVLLKYIYDNWGLSYFSVMLIPFLLSLLMLPITFFLLPSHSVRKREHKLMVRWEEYLQQCENQQIELTTFDEDNNNRRRKAQFVTKQQLLVQIAQNTAIEERQNSINNMLAEGVVADADQQELECLNGGEGKRAKPVVVVQGAMSQPQPHQSIWEQIMSLFKGQTQVDDIPLRVSLLSMSFLAHQLWFSWLNTYMVLYSGSLVLWLGRVTDDQATTRTFTQAFGLVQVTALVFAPIAGFVMDYSVRKGMTEPIAMLRKLRQAQSGFIPILITTIMLVFAVVARFFNQPLAVYISIVFITLLRSFLIAVASAYIRVRFPASHFNRLNGIMCTTGAFFSLLQFPLFYYESLGGDYAFYVNLFCAIMTAISMINPILLGLTNLQRKLLQREEDYERKLAKMQAKRSAKAAAAAAV